MSISNRIKQAVLNVALFSGLLQGQEALKPESKAPTPPAPEAPMPLPPHQVEKNVLTAMEKKAKSDLKDESIRNFKVSPPDKYKDVHAMIEQLRSRAKEVAQKLPDSPNPYLKMKMTIPENPVKLVVFESKYIYATALPPIGGKNAYFGISSAFLKMPKAKQRSVLAHEFSHLIFGPPYTNIMLWTHYNRDLVNTYLEYLDKKDVPQDKRDKQYQEIIADGMAVLLTCDAKSLADTLDEMGRSNNKRWTEKRMKELKDSPDYKNSTRAERHKMEQKVKGDAMFSYVAGEADIRGTHPGGYMRKEILKPIEPLGVCPVPPKPRSR